MQTFLLTTEANFNRHPLRTDVEAFQAATSLAEEADVPKTTYPDTYLVKAQSHSHAQTVARFRGTDTATFDGHPEYGMCLSVPWFFSLPCDLACRGDYSRLPGWARYILIQATIGYWARLKAVEKKAEQKSVESFDSPVQVEQR